MIRGFEGIKDTGAQHRTARLEVRTGPTTSRRSAGEECKARAVCATVMRLRSEPLLEVQDFPLGDQAISRVRDHFKGAPAVLWIDCYASFFLVASFLALTLR